MSGFLPVVLLLGKLAVAQTQEANSLREGLDSNPDTPQALINEPPCEEGLREDGTILVCRELEDSERYMSPLPREIDPQIRILPGFEPPPCENNLLSFCGRFGGGGSPPLMIDLDSIPEALSDEERALVSRAPDAGALAEAPDN